MNIIEKRKVDNMSVAPIMDQVPIETDIDGVIRVGKTRVPLDTVLTEFNKGATAEEIAYKYPALQLSDIYSVIAYYLRQQKDIDDYLKKRQKISKKIHKQNQLRFHQPGIRERLIARQTECQK